MTGGSCEGAIRVPDAFREGARRFLGGCQVVLGRVPVGSWESAIRVPGGSWEGAKWFLGGCLVVPGTVP